MECVLLGSGGMISLPREVQGMGKKNWINSLLQLLKALKGLRDLGRCPVPYRE